MKINYIIAIAISVILTTSCEKENSNDENPSVLTDSVTMGANYAHDVYYNLASGASFEASPDNWDIGFRTYYMSSSVFINSGAGIKLYEFSKDTADFYTDIDTAGYASLPVLYNSLENWETGAFSANMTGGFNFGWGNYDMDTHDLNGAATYLIELQDGSLKKMFIRQKHSIDNIYYFLFAAPDGNNEQSVILDCSNYTGKEFVYYSVAENHVVDRDPVKGEWDLLFTRYYDPSAHYIVTGVLLKPGEEAEKISGVSTDLADTTMGQFSPAPGVIGYDWKTINMDTYQYSLVNDLTFFIKTTSHNVFKLYFTGFDGGSTGISRFMKEEIR